MILLEKLLAGLEVAVDPFAICEVKGQARLDLGRQAEVSMHYTLAGSGLLHVEGHKPIPVGRDCLMIVPAHTAQWLATTGGEAAPLESAHSCRPLGGGIDYISLIADHDVRGPSILMACGAVKATYLGGLGLFDCLTEPIVVDANTNTPIRRTFETLIDELARPQPGAQALTGALMQQCLVFLLRQHCEGGECRVHWLAALADQRLAEALRVMLERPEAAHSVEQLAALAVMSRSAFAERFNESFGRPPMAFLKDLRMRRAAEKLRNTDEPIKTLAASVGYDSRSQFSHAFKEFYGVSPAGYRAMGQAT